MRFSVTGLVRTLREKNFVRVFGSFVINKIVGFLSGLLLVRILSKGDYGVYSYAYSLLNIFILFNGFGSVSAVLHMSSETNDRDKKNRISSFGYRFGAKYSLLLCTAILLVSIFVPFAVRGSNALLGLMTLIPFFSFFDEMQKNILRADLKNRQFALSSNVGTVLLCAGSVVGAFLWGTYGLIAGRYLAIIAGVVFAALILEVPVKFRGSALGENDKGLFFKISAMSFLGSGLNQLTFFIGSFMVGLLLGSDEAVASYQVAMTIPMAITFISSALVIFVYPYFVQHRDDYRWVKSNLTRIMLAMALVSIILAVVCVLFAEPIIALIFGSQYLDAVLPFRILMICFIFRSTINMIGGNLLGIYRKQSFVAIVALAAVVMLILLNFLLVPTYGIMGASIAFTVIMFLTGSVYTLYLLLLVRRLVR